MGCDRLMPDRPYGRDKRYRKTWRCAVCQKVTGLSNGSFFQSSKLHPFTVLKVAYSYLVVELNHSAIRMLLSNAPGEKSINDWLQFIRDVLSKNLIQELRNSRIGGPGRVVVIDETAFEKRKYHRGKPIERETIWV